MSTLAKGSAIVAGMLAVAAAGIALTRPGRRVGKHRRPRAARWQGWRTATARLATAFSGSARSAGAASASAVCGRGTGAGTGGALAGPARTGDNRGVPGPAGHPGPAVAGTALRPAAVAATAA